jgi:ATP-dependent DNA helicase RecG
MNYDVKKNTSMNRLSEIINQPEGRRLEFKEMLPSNADLAKTIIAFANDAGGEFYLGIKDDPREIVGLDETKLIGIEEKITNIIHDQCHPIILPEITFLNLEGKHIIKVQIFKGSNPPYFIKKKGFEEGIYPCWVFESPGINRNDC